MRRRLLAPVLALLLASCAKDPPVAEWTPIPEPTPEAVDAVVFLVGDAGEALPGRSPLLRRLALDVEAWSERLATEGVVNVLYLGDNIYPTGLHDRGHPDFVGDSLKLHSQVEVLAGPNARRHGSRGFFMAGNHDWGQRQGYSGLLRLQNQETLLRSYADQGIDVDMVPDAGDAGPFTVDAGRTVRFAFLDTHWWLQAEESITRDTVFISAEQLLRGAGERSLLFASHHPFASGGAHGGPVPFWHGLGILFLLRKTGALVQDLNSVIYQELLNGLGALFEEIRQPLIYAGGHDHSLQVIERFGADMPQWSLVSGSASKLTDVGPARGMIFGADKPGYMQLLYRKDGAVDLQVIAGPDEAQHCGDDDGEIVPDDMDPDEELSECMAAGVTSYETVFAAQLRGPRPIVADTAGSPRRR